MARQQDDWLTRLACNPFSMRALALHKEDGFLQLLKRTYGRYLEEDQVKLLRFIETTFASDDAAELQLLLLNTLNVEESLQAVFRKSMSSEEDKAAFDVFLDFLSVQLILLETQPFSPGNSCQLVNEFVTTVLSYAWLPRNLKFMRDHSQPLLEVALKPEEEEVDSLPTSADDEEALLESLLGTSDPVSGKRKAARGKRPPKKQRIGGHIVDLKKIRNVLEAHQKLPASGLPFLDMP